VFHFVNLSTKNPDLRREEIISYKNRKTNTDLGVWHSSGSRAEKTVWEFWRTQKQRVEA